MKSQAVFFKPKMFYWIATQLTDEVDKFAREEGDKKVRAEYKKTSLREPMMVFDQFLSNLSETWKGKRMAVSDGAMEF